MSLASTIIAMADAGCSIEQIRAVAAKEADDEALMKEARREKARAGNAERQRMHRERNANNGVTQRDSALHTVTDHSPYKDNHARACVFPVGLSNDSPPLNKTLSSLSLASLAERFYSVCPKKIGPDAAKRKFISLAKAGKDPEAIIAAMEAWSEAWRLAGTEKQFIPAPTVWLNRGDYASTDYPTPSKSNVALFTPSNAPRKFRIDRDSKQGKAWEAHMASIGKRIPWANSAWYFESEWPPPDAPIPFTEAAE